MKQDLFRLTLMNQGVPLQAFLSNNENIVILREKNKQKRKQLTIRLNLLLQIGQENGRRSFLLFELIN